jgi:hypothetical protein
MGWLADQALATPPPLRFRKRESEESRTPARMRRSFPAYGVVTTAAPGVGVTTVEPGVITVVLGAATAGGGAV